MCSADILWLSGAIATFAVRVGEARGDGWRGVVFFAVYALLLWPLGLSVFIDRQLR